LVPIMDKSHIATVSRGDNQIGQPALNMTFTDQGAEIFDNYAAANVGHQFAIVVDETIVSAPVINEPEFNGQVQISGPSDPGEFALLLSLMQLPRLPVTLTETLSADVTPPPGC